VKESYQPGTSQMGPYPVANTGVALAVGLIRAQGDQGIRGNTRSDGVESNLSVGFFRGLIRRVSGPSKWQRETIRDETVQRREAEIE